MNPKAFFSMNLLGRACMLSIALCVAMLATNAQALPEPKVAITYSLEVEDGGAYRQKISETPSDLGNVDYVVDVGGSGDPSVVVFTDTPLLVTMEFTLDGPGGDIIDGPVELTDVHFEREFELDASSLTLVHTTISTVLERKGTGTLSGSTITWDNLVPYQELVLPPFSMSTCTGIGCGFVTDPFPRDLSGIQDVILPTFTVFTNTVFADEFASDNGTPGDPSDDIDRPDPDATVKDTWVGVEVVPEPRSEILLLAGALGIVGLGRVRGGASV
jgi:hypothetical protein